jgi:spermidine/putrescine transport system permease protein
MLAFFVALGVEFGMATICIAHITYCATFVTMAALGQLHDSVFTLFNALRSLGVSPWVVARKVLVVSMMNRHNLPIANALSILMIASSFLLAALAFRLQTRD